MSVRTVIDGVLLADCERRPQIRYGTNRVAEEVTKRLLHHPALQLYFANTRLTQEEDTFLRKYLSRLDVNRSRMLSYPLAGFPVTKLDKLAAQATRSLRPGTVTRLDRFDLFHSFFYPFSKSVQRSKITKCITYYDIIPLRIEGYEENAGRMKAIIESIIPNFSISISQFSKDDLCGYDKRVDPQRIFVAPLAADKNLFYPNKQAADWQRVKAKYDLPDRYFLSISGLDKRKNLEHLIYAFDKLVLQQNTHDLCLVMTGNMSFENTVFQRLDIDKKTKEKIIFTRSLDEADLCVVYSHALCFFFMSFYEGFGLPVLEAMQCGTPVITSNATSIPEVVGNAGIMLPPHDRDSLCSAMWKVYTDGALRSQLSQSGLKRADEFSWDRCAQTYAAIFKEIGQ